MDKKVSINIATQPHRLDTLKLMVESIYNQVDVIRIYLNNFIEIPTLHNPDNKIVYAQGKDLTDNGKFYFLDNVQPNEYYFTADDDLIYPPDYIETMIDYIDRYDCIVTVHGRVLQGKNKHYYRDHLAFMCLETVTFEDAEVIKVDVCGTGVTGFNTNYFLPKGIHKAKEQRMSDLVFSLEASKQNKTIGLIQHYKGWIKDAQPNDGGVFNYWQGKLQDEQTCLADEIYDLNYGKG